MKLRETIALVSELKDDLIILYESTIPSTVLLISE